MDEKERKIIIEKKGLIVLKQSVISVKGEVDRCNSEREQQEAIKISLQDLVGKKILEVSLKN